MTADERIAALETRIDELTATLARHGRRDSMMKTYTCPRCGGGSFLGIKQISEYGHNTMVPLSLGNKGLGFWGPKLGDPLQAYVCKSCRFVEWQIAILDKLVADGDNVIEFNRPEEPSLASDDPYR